MNSRTMSTSTINSTIKGKAYEYASIIALIELVQPLRPVEVVESSSLAIAKARYIDDISETERAEMLLSAKAGIGTIISMEPKIIEDGDDTLTVSLQPDNVARLGDVRDVLIIRRSIEWEVGVSVKHNHEALKHSRLSARLDFGQSWYGIPASQAYFAEIEPIFTMLQEMKTQGRLWRELPDKEQTVYLPILEAFMRELNREYRETGDDVTEGLVKYLIGSNGNDYYKLIHYRNRTTRVIPYNLYGTLNSASATSEPEATVPEIDLPTRIIELALKEGSKTTAILTMDNGWSISFRIHNASSRVESSLKFDIKLIGQPSSLFFVDVAW